jgi:hypothetical protein
MCRRWGSSQKSRSLFRNAGSPSNGNRGPGEARSSAYTAIPFGHRQTERRLVHRHFQAIGHIRMKPDGGPPAGYRLAIDLDLAKDYQQPRVDPGPISQLSLSQGEVEVVPCVQ